MRVLLACEETGIVRDAFRSLGHDAISVDLNYGVPSSYHVRGDALELAYSGKFDLMIGFPPCTYLCKAQIWRVNKEPIRKQLSDEAIVFFKALYNAPIKRIALENPIGMLTKAFRPPDQIIYPYNFGDPYRKDICLWLKNLPLLVNTELSPGRKSVSNHVNGRMSQAVKSRIKSRFFVGVAKAMANQWGSCDG